MEDLQNLSFEEALAELEKIVRELETGRTKLDDAINSYEKAILLKKLCEDRLKNAQLTIEKLEVSANGEMKYSEFEEK